MPKAYFPCQGGGKKGLAVLASLRQVGKIMCHIKSSWSPLDVREYINSDYLYHRHYFYRNWILLLKVFGKRQK